MITNGTLEAYVTTLANNNLCMLDFSESTMFYITFELPRSKVLNNLKMGEMIERIKPSKKADKLLSTYLSFEFYLTSQIALVLEMESWKHFLASKNLFLGSLFLHSISKIQIKLTKNSSLDVKIYSSWTDVFSFSE